jgi:glycosyltransferase involved in cell wall biosynthesis
MDEILMLTPQLPYPPHQGTSLRNLHLLRAMAESNHVTLLSFAEEELSLDVGPLRALAEVWPPVAAPRRSSRTRLRQLLTSGLPDMALRLADERFAAALAETLRRRAFDVVQIEGLEMAAYMGDVRRHAPGARVVLDCHNAETELQRRSRRADAGRPARWPAALYSATQIGRLARFERWAVGAADAVIAVSEIDRAHLAALGGKPAKAIAVVPNTIDVAAYAQPPSSGALPGYDLVFTGKLDYRPNVDAVLWFAQEIWPQIQASRPGTTWAVVGQRPHRRLDALRELPGVTLTGRVADIHPYLAGSRVYVAPLRIGSGTRLKIIEAMAASMAIVSTRVGAEGFPVTNGEQLLLADEPNDFAAALLELLDDDQQRAALGAAARVFAEHYDWRQIAPLLEAVYSSIE